jgi:hypothetical protein
MYWPTEKAPAILDGTWKPPVLKLASWRAQLTGPVRKVAARWFTTTAIRWWLVP